MNAEIEKVIAGESEGSRWKRVVARFRKLKHSAMCANVLYLLDRGICMELHGCPRHGKSITDADVDAVKICQKRFDDQVRSSIAKNLQRLRQEAKKTKEKLKAAQSAQKEAEEKLAAMKKIFPRTQAELLPPDYQPLVKAIYELVFAMQCSRFDNELDRQAINCAYSAARKHLAEAMQLSPDAVWLPTCLDAYRILQTQIEMQFAKSPATG